MALMHGFCTPQAAAPGERIEFRTSTTADSFTLTIVRFRNRKEVSANHICTGQELVEHDAIPKSSATNEPPGRTGHVRFRPDPWDRFLRIRRVLPGRQQPSHVPSDPCMDWSPAFSLDVTEDWKSGMYAAKCVDADGSTFYIVFVINPNPKRRNPILVLANTNTWNAYNDMGGFSRYEIPENSDLPYVFAFQRPNPNLINPSIHDGDVSPFSPRAADHNVPFQSRHLARAEMWFLNWLDEAGYEFDVTTDLDWHFGVADVEQYAAVVLHTHPEYWTVQMLKNLQKYLNQGGNLLYLGGNGIFDVVEISPDGARMTVFGTRISPIDLRTKLFRGIGTPESLTLGIRYIEPNLGAGQGGPYAVGDVPHRFLVREDGTAMAPGTLIGERGWNIPVNGTGLESGAASGWEVDSVDPSNSPDGLKVLAKDISTYSDNAVGAEMVYYVRHPGGGFVFSTGSIRFCGSLMVDSNAAQIVKNVLDECVGPPPLPWDPRILKWLEEALRVPPRKPEPPGPVETPENEIMLGLLVTRLAAHSRSEATAKELKRVGFTILAEAAQKALRSMA